MLTLIQKRISAPGRAIRTSCKDQPKTMQKLIILFFLAMALTGCATDEAPFRNSATMDQIYDTVNSSGGADTVRLLREGLRARPELGSSDPYYPIRNPDVVAPVWVVPYADKRTGVKHGGRWDYVIMEEAGWAN
ncbi:conjugal transfer protein [Pseudomonas veronii 1YdBTEX2]|uniref:Conjugal transfer protein n=1 Tax=Pseudomonas veronii 1YdBTEX2 TaxID=1295141 RepID=A0A1D3K8H1_PSEVE|nr:conjugal transfer protein [Pseudomonas veronii 1YdBTEX2]